MPFKQLPTLNQGQQDVQNQILQQLLQANPQIFQYLTSLLQGGPEATAAFNEPYLRQFQQEIVPGITERFGGQAGSSGALNSSGLNQSLAAAGSNLEATLASLREGLKGQAVNSLQSYLNPGFQSSFQTIYKEPRPNFLQQISPFLGSILGKGLSAGLGGLF